MRSGVKSGHLQLVSDNQVDEIHTAALKVLREKGIKIEHEVVLSLLAENGADVDFDSGITKFPESLVVDSIAKSPSTIRLCGRDEKNDIVLETDRSYFSACGGSPNVLDYVDGGELRKPTKKDIAKAVRVQDDLPNIDLTWPMFTLTEDPMLGLYMLYLILKENTKPGGIANWYGRELTKKQIEMVELVSEETRSEKKPLIIMYGEPVSPLTFRRENMEMMLEWTKRGLPLIWYPAPQLGGTAPTTLPGALAQGLSESLGGLVIAQLNNPGTPVVVGSLPMIMDMRNGETSWVFAERILHQSFDGKWARMHGVPTFGMGGCTDSYDLDFQAGVQSLQSLYGSVLGGQNLIHDLGLTGSGEAYSIEHLILVNEMIDMIKRAVDGIEINSETLALDVIEDVDHGDTFLTHPHTRKFSTKGMFQSDFLKSVGKKEWTFNYSIKEASRKKEKILEREREPLPEDVDKRLREIISEGRRIWKER